MTVASLIWSRFSRLAVLALPVLALLLTWTPLCAKAIDDELPVDKVVVIKSKRELQLWHGDMMLETFRVALGRKPKGHKAFEGDGRTPEGRYYLQGWKSESNFYRAMHISYPNSRDREFAHKAGRSPGGAIMLHGLADEILDWGSDHYLFNWTEGCIALTDEEMDVIWRRVRPGTPIEIMP